MYATNVYDANDLRTLPNPNNTNTQCLKRMSRSGDLTLDGSAMTSECFSNLVRCAVASLCSLTAAVRGHTVNWASHVTESVAVR